MSLNAVRIKAGNKEIPAIIFFEIEELKSSIIPIIK